MINIKPYLAELERNQTVRGKNKLSVPTLKDIANAIGMNEKAFLRIANNQTKYLNLEKFDAMIEFLQSKGFNTQVSDLIVRKTKRDLE